MIFPPSEEELSTTNLDNDDLENDKPNPEIVNSAPSAVRTDEGIDDSWVAVEKPHPTAVPDATVSKESQSK